MLQKYFPLQLPNNLISIVLSDQMKPTCAINVSHSRQRQSLGNQDMMRFLNLVNDPQCFI